MSLFRGVRASVGSFAGVVGSYVGLGGAPVSTSTATSSAVITASASTDGATSATEGVVATAVKSGLDEKGVIAVLQSIEPGTPSPEFFQLLIELVTNCDDSQQIDYLRVLFHFMGQCVRDYQIDLLKKLNYSIKLSGMHTAAQLCARHWVLRLLGMLHNSTSLLIHEELIRLIHTLASFTITVHELKYLLKLMEVNKTERPVYWPHLLNDVLRAITPGEGPDAFWNFSGRNSGLQLPAMVKFPGDGYTFAAWIRFESLADPTCADQSFTPYLLSLQTNELNGLEIFIDQRHLTIRTTLNQSKYASKALQHEYFVTKRWYFLVVSHAYRLIATSEVSLFLNGKLVASANLVYPRADNMPWCYIGTNTSSSAKTSAFPLVANLKQQPLAAQMGQVLMLHGAAESADVAALFALGPNFIVQSESALEPHLAKKGLKPLFTYHPKASNGILCYEISSGAQGRCASQLPGTSVVRSLPLHTAFYRAGGVKLLLPLFKQLGLPQAKSPEEVTFESIDYKDESQPSALAASTIFGLRKPEAKESVQQVDFVNLLSFAAGLILRDPILLHDMAHWDFFTLLSFSFTKLPASIWTRNSITSLDQLGAAVATSNSLKKQFFRHTIANYEIWANTSLDVQAQVASLFMNYSRESPEYIREIVGVGPTLDILRFYYWFTPEEGVSRSTNHEGIERPPSLIRQIRMLLLKSVELFTKAEFSIEEVRLFVYYLQNCKDDDQCLDILRFLLNFIGVPNNTLVQCLHKVKGIPVLLCLMRHKNSDVRFCSLKLLCYTLKACQNPSSGVSVEMLNTYFWTLKHYLQQFPFTKSISNVLMELLLDCLSPTIQSSFTITRDCVFKFPQVLPVLFELLCLSGHPGLQKSILSDFVLLLSQEKSWHTAQNEMLEVISQIFSSLLLHAFRLKNGWAMILESYSLLDYFSERGLLNTKTLFTSITKIMLEKLSRDQFLLAEFKAEAGGMLHFNVSWWLCLVGVHLFPGEDSGAAFDFDRFMASLNRDPLDSTWTEFHTAQRVLEFLDSIYEQDAVVVVEQQPPTPPPSKLNQPHTTVQATSVPKSTQNQTPRTTTQTQPSALQQSPVPAQPDPDSLLINATVESITLRLILTSLQETDCFINTGRQQKRSQDLKSLESTAPGTLSGLSSFRASESLARYLRNKEKDWNAEQASYEAVMEQNCSRLRKHVDRVLQEGQKGKLMFIISFLAQAMKAAYSRQGNATVILSLFQELLSKIKSQFLPSLESDDEVIQIFMGHFFREPNPILQSADVDMQTFVQLEHQMFSFVKQKSSECKTATTMRLSSLVNEEHIGKAKMEQEISLMSEEFLAEESVRLEKFRSAHHRLQVAKRNLWREFTQNLWPTNFDHWLLDHTENQQRMRKRLKPNRKFDPHKDKVPVSRAEILSTADSASILGMEQTTIAPIPSSLASEQDDNSPPETDVHPSSETKPSEPPQVFHYRYECELIEPMTATPGYFEFSNKNFHFIANTALSAGTVGVVSVNPQMIEQTWQLSELHTMYTRRYLLRDSGLELFFENRTNTFLNFPTNAQRNVVYKNISRTLSPVLGTLHSLVDPLTPVQLLKKQALTEQWVARKISNFDYLMALNTIAGRTYNDLTQYPVFPWILADYTSETLDLTNPATFRDLSTPMGALSPEKREEAIQRYQAFNDPETPKFHHGTHYSTLGCVLHYLIRMEPFTTYFLEFQGGKFDHPNRMFLGVGQSWANAFLDTSSVKELIPEFFYQPEFLVNRNRFNFGLPFHNPAPTDGNGLVPPTVGDVILPPWAKGSPDLFILLHRQALESDYVSEHLNEWIDLIFGHKQRGEAAIAACNVFFHLTYEGSVNLEKIVDKQLRDSLISQIYNFGQTPSQLFLSPHPKRTPRVDTIGKNIPNSSMASSPCSFELPIPAFSCPLSAIIGVNSQKIVTLALDGTLGVSTFSANSDSKGLPFTLTLDSTINNPRAKKVVETLYAPNLQIRDTIAVNPDLKAVYTCGDWGAQFHMRSPAGKITRIVPHGSDVISCLALDGNYLVLGSRDSTIAVFNVSNTKLGKSKHADPFAAPLQMLYGHSGQVSCLSIREDYDLVVSASHGTAPLCLVHALRTGALMHTLPFEEPVDQVQCTSQGSILVYQKLNTLFSVFTVNAHLLCSAKLGFITNFCASPDGNWIAAAHLSSGISIYSAHSMKLAHKFETNSPVTAMCYLHEGSFLIAGLATGGLTVFIFTPKMFVLL
ncbi:beach protein [Pelomyxa schiedti]|nr:beach protein [Pelomyxa schiedti]